VRGGCQKADFVMRHRHIRGRAFLQSRWRLNAPSLNGPFSSITANESTDPGKLFSGKHVDGAHSSDRRLHLDFATTFPGDFADNRSIDRKSVV